MSDNFDQICHFVYDEFEKANSDFNLMRPEIAIFHRVQVAQGVIDNGGLVYFFVKDWIGYPSYDDFVASYREIGCESAAKCIEQAAQMFPFEDPELFGEKRREFIDKHIDHDSNEVDGWDDSICGDETIYPALEAYAKKHPKIFHIDS